MIDISKINFEKGNGLIPVIAQDSKTNKVLMLGFADLKSVQVTIESGHLTFFSRTKNRVWTKGEESGHFLMVEELKLDCDQDTILAKVKPVGPTCHTGSDTCWNEKNEMEDNDFILSLESVINERKGQTNNMDSYITTLFAKGINKIAQKVGEEAVELVIEAKDTNPELFLGEAADLLFHYLILLQAKGYRLADVVEVLKLRSRH